MAINTIEAATNALAAKMAEQKDAIKAELRAEVIEEVRAELVSAKQEESPNAKGWVPEGVMRKHYTPPENPADAGLRLAMGVRAFVASGKNMFGVPKFINDTIGDKETAKYYEKSIDTQSLSSGGVFLTDTLLFAEMFPVLRSRSWLMAAGAQVIMANTDKVTIPGMSAGFSSYWVGETKRIRTSTQAFQQIKLNAKKNAGILVISNDWLREGKNPGVDAIIRDDMVGAINEGLHYGAVFGDGSEEQPLGIMNDGRAGTISVGALPNTTTLSKFLKAQMDANLDFNPLQNAHVMSAALYILYYNMVDSYGRFHYREEMSRHTPDAPWGTINGIKVFVYTKITESNASHNPTSLMSGLWSEYKILMREAVEMIEAPDGTIVDTDGTVISGLQNDVTFLRVLAKQDGKLRQAGAVNKSVDVWTTT